MKNKIIILTLLSVVLISLSACFNCKDGSGKIQTQTTELSEFDALEINVPANIYIRQADKYSVEINTNENLIELIETDVRRGTLKINSKKCINKFDKFDIHISVKDLEEIEMNGSGKISNTGVIKVKKLEVSLTGSGKIELNINVDKLISELTGSGEIKYQGNAEKHDAEITGSGDIKAYKLNTEDADIEISGSGSCKVKVSDNLDAEITGSGNVYYKGNLQKLDSNITGSGKIISDK